MGHRIPALRPGRFGWGAAQLSGASLLSRAIGFAYSAAVMRLAGPEAVGLFRLVWPVYSTAFTLATSGIPYAMAKLIAERIAPAQEPGPRRHPSPQDARAVLRLARQGLVLLALNAGLVTVAAWLAGPWLVGRLGAEPRALPIFQMLVPSLSVAALASGCRALFEAVRRMAVPAASLVLEQAVLAGAAVYLVWHLGRDQASPPTVAAGLGFASVLGEAAGLILSGLALNALWSSWLALARSAPPRQPPAIGDRRPGAPGPRRGRGPAGRPAGWTPGEILALAVPVASGRIAASVGGSLNALLLPNRLQAAGLSPSAAAAQVGLLRGVALPMVMMPNMLSLALMTTLVPSISRAMARGRPDLARVYSDKAIAATALFAFPCTAALAAFSDVLTRLLYGEAEAAPLLAIASAAAPFIYLGQTLVGVLRGLGRPHVPVHAHLAGLAVDSAIVWWLAAHPDFGIRAAALASVGGYLTAWAVVQVDALRHLGTDLRPSQLGLPLVGAICGAAVGRLAAVSVASAALARGLPGPAADLVGLTAGLGLLSALYLALVRPSRLWAWVFGR